MKQKRKINESSRFRDDYDDFYYNDHDDYNYKSYEEDDMKEEKENLCYLLRQMFYGKIDSEIDIDMEDMDIIMTIELKQSEYLDNIIEIFKIVKKIENEILPMYYAFFEIYSSKNKTILIFEFNYTEDDDKIDDDIKNNKFSF